VDKARRSRRSPRRSTLVALAVVAAAVLAAAVAGCGGSSSAATTDPLVGYWVGGGNAGQMTLVHIQRDGDTYTVLANPDTPTAAAKKEGAGLVVDTHAVIMRFTPQSADKLELEFTGEMFKKPASMTLQRTDETGYADASTAYGILAIRRGLAMWKAGGGKTYPPPKEVTPSGMLAQMIHWPINLFTAQPMQPGRDAGNYTYGRLDGGKKYSLVGHLSDGSTIGK
jgi:hypothetical protein